MSTPTRLSPTPPDVAATPGAAVDRARWGLLLNGIMASVAVVGATLFLMSPMLPDIAAGLGVRPSRVVALPGVYGAVLAVSAPLSSLLMQSLPRVASIVAGLLLFGMAWLLGALSTQFAHLLAAAAVAGTATGLVLPACYALAGDLSTWADRGRTMGRVVGGWSIAMLSVIPVSALVQAGAWRHAFATLGGLALVTAVWMALAPRPARRAEAGGDAGSAVAPAPVSTAGPGTGTASGARPAVPARGGLLGALTEVLGHRPTRVLLAVNALDMGGFFAIYAYLGSELRRLHDWGAGSAGLVIGAYGIGLTIVTFNGRLIDRLGKQRTARIGLLLLGGWLLLLPWFAHHPILAGAAVLCWGLVQGSVFTSLTALSTELLPARRGIVTALLSGSTYVGTTLFTLLAVPVYERGGYPLVGVLAAGASLLACAWLLRTRLEPGPEPQSPSSTHPR